MDPVSDLTLPVAVIGAGPIGLAAAAHLRERGLGVVVLEAGPNAASSVRAWGHVRLFSQWSELIDPAARRMLTTGSWSAPDAGAYPTGREWAVEYLQPLADALGESVHYDVTVTGVAKAGRDLVVDAGREEQPFTIHLTHADGSTSRLLARAVVDASGTYSHPNPLGGDGYPAHGEGPDVATVTYRVPDVSDDADLVRFAGRRTAVVGAGHSALTALVSLASLAQTQPGTRVVWVLRRGTPGNAFGGGVADQLPARGALGQRARQAVEDGRVTVVTGFRTATVESTDAGVALVSQDGGRVDHLDQVIGLTGFRPDHSMMRELRLELDDRLEAPRRLAPLIDPNVHSCGTVYPHGAAELAHSSEPGVFLVGMKSYGRAPTFLAMTGYEQVRSVVAVIAGDQEAAAHVELTLPETGVCGGAGIFVVTDESTGAGCCGTAGPQPISLGAPARVAAG